MMGKNTTFGVMAFFLVGTPTSLIVEHEERIPVFLVQQLFEVLVEQAVLHQAPRNEVILDTFILNVPINGLDVL